MSTPLPPGFSTDLTKDFVPSLGTDVMHGSVPAEWPAYATHHKIAIVGEQPGKDEFRERKPFVGASGNLLFSSLRRYGINKADCLVTNVSQHALPEVKGKQDQWRHVSGEDLVALRSDISAHDPHCILLCGALALKAAFPDEKRSITDWRGSILEASSASPFAGRKCIPCIHPAAVFRDWSLWPLFTFDLERFGAESRTAALNLPQRTYEIDVPVERAIARLVEITNIRTPVALDIEGGVYGMSCVSFALSPYDAFIVPLSSYSDADKIRVLRALYDFLSSSTPKILQNSLYDNFVLMWTYRSVIRNVIHDTMLSGWEIYPELLKGLGTQVSIWTREPFYKFMRKLTRKKDVDGEETTVNLENTLTPAERQTLHLYCCKDSACTYEIYDRHRAHFTERPDASAHFQFNMSLLPALLYMQHRGIRYDRTTASLLLTQTNGNLLRLQGIIDLHIRRKWAEYGARGETPPSLNINSSKQVCETLYTRLGYPKQHPKKKGGRGRERDTTKVTANIDALLELRKTYNGPDDEILEHILQWRKQDGLRETLEIRTDQDGRVRCGYNIVGTETGRLTCYGSPTGSGANLTTITSSLRRLYTADEDHFFFQCDLAGADGWTVAAHCANCGDSTMLDDYLSGLKPAKIITLYWRHGDAVLSWDRDRLKAESKAVSEKGEDGWQYFASKRVYHGTDYDLQPPTMSLQILKDSYNKLGKTVVVSKHECQRLQDFVHRRYPGIKMWHRWVQRQLDEHQTLGCASGHVRRFFGRRYDQQTYREAYAHEPQANTTYATNLALRCLWTDPENRQRLQPHMDGDTRQGLRPFLVEPLHHVHDALCGQFHKRDLAYAIPAIKQWFANPLLIAGRTITIPFEGQYGPSWGQLGSEYGGGNI